MTYTTIRTDVDDGILTVTLNRPDKLNAFTLVMADELIDAFGRASADDAIRAVIVTGAGRGFCAGMDLGAGDAVNLELEPTAPARSAPHRFAGLLPPDGPGW